tara:strand:+ start:1639 stop:2394 length:756 start_codon:yes stop_codon:yes gene_type:complete
MKLIFITTCKPFDEEYSWKQEQSIKSWMALKGIEKKIIIVGNDKGVKDFCEENNLIHHPNIKTFGPVPYLHDMLEVANSHAAQEDVIIWTNADMIYFQNMVDTIMAFKRQINTKDYILVGQRYDWKQPRKIDITDPSVIDHIIKNESTLHASCGIDYVIHSKTSLVGHFHKDLVIAGTSHDMKILGVGMKNSIPTIDCLKTITAIHHDHSRPPVDKKRLNNNQRCSGKMVSTDQVPNISSLSNGNIIFKGR